MRKLSQQAQSDQPPQLDPLAAQRDQVVAALQQDQGPAMLTVAVNMVTGRASISGTMRSDAEMRAILSALQQAQAHVLGLLEKAAEARGRAAAQAPAQGEAPKEK